jgi:hypothetical protein
MTWWMILILVWVILRIASRRNGHELGGCGARRNLPREATSAPPLAAVPDPRRELERTIEAVRQEYVSGRIEIGEYERKLDELYRTAEGRKLTQGV